MGNDESRGEKVRFRPRIHADQRGSQSKGLRKREEVRWLWIWNPINLHIHMILGPVNTGQARLRANTVPLFRNPRSSAWIRGKYGIPAKRLRPRRSQHQGVGRNL